MRHILTSLPVALLLLATTYVSPAASPRPQPVLAPPVVIGVQATAVTSASTSIAVSKSQIVNLKVGDLLVIQLGYTGTEHPSTGPLGWSGLIVHTNEAGLSQSVYVKRAELNDLTINTYTFSWRKRRLSSINANFLVITGADTSSVYSYPTSKAGGNDYTPTSPPVCPCTTDSLILQMITTRSVDDVMAPPELSEASEVMATQSAPNQVRSQVSAKQHFTTGLTPSYAASIPTAQPWLAGAIVVLSARCTSGGPSPAI